MWTNQKKNVRCSGLVCEGLRGFYTCIKGKFLITKNVGVGSQRERERLVGEGRVSIELEILKKTTSRRSRRRRVEREERASRAKVA